MITKNIKKRRRSINSVAKINIKNPKNFPENPLEEIIRERARKILQTAIELEVQDFCKQHHDLLNEKGH